MMSTLLAPYQALSTVPTNTRHQVNYKNIDGFLADIERRAFVIAEAATRSPDEALDLVQDSMLAFVKNYAKKPQNEWPPLFFRVLQNRIRDWARRGKVRNRWNAWLGKNHDEETEPQDPIQQLADPAGRSMQELLDQSSATDEIINAVHALPLRQQQAFLLRTWEGLDVASTALAMKCSSGSVKTHLSRALKNLRGKLQEYQL